MTQTAMSCIPTDMTMMAFVRAVISRHEQQGDGEQYGAFFYFALLILLNIIIIVIVIISKTKLMSLMKRK